MIVIARRVGRLGNRLLLFAHFIACAREHNVAVCNPAFHEYARYFEATRHDLWCCYRPAGPVLPQRCTAPREPTRRLLYHAVYLPARWLAAVGCTNWPVKTIRITMQERYDLGSREFAQLVQAHPLVLVQGWAFRDEAAVQRHSDAIREYFRPIRTLAARTAQVVASAGQRGDVLVGLHCRQGDYRTAFGGKYYYTIAQYRAIMQRVIRFFAPRKVAFLVCGDEPQDPTLLADLNVTWGSGHAVEDMYALARCDYLLGPPSTFTAWASFYGRVPLCRLTAADGQIEFSSATCSGNLAA